MNSRHTSLLIPAISIKSQSCQKGSNCYDALHNAVHNCNQSQHCTIDIFLIGYEPLVDKRSNIKKTDCEEQELSKSYSGHEKTKSCPVTLSCPVTSVTHEGRLEVRV